MVLIPTNEQLLRYALKRPRFYALRADINVRFIGSLQPVGGHWAYFDPRTKTLIAVPLTELRAARMYVHKSSANDSTMIYLFVYGDQEKHYYTIPPQYVDLWLNEGMRTEMLTGDEA